MTVKQAYDLVLDTDYLKLVEIGAVRVAIAVANEAETVPRTEERKRLASRVANAPQAAAQTFGRAIIGDDAFLALLFSQVNTQYQLAQIENRIGAVWNAYV